MRRVTFLLRHMEFSEREALEAIFEHDISFSGSTCRLKLRRGADEPPAELFFAAPHTLTGLSAAWLSREDASRILHQVGEDELHSIFEVQDAVVGLLPEKTEAKPVAPAADEQSADDFADVVIYQGEKVTDRKS